jgi:hypothetical protein
MTKEEFKAKMLGLNDKLDKLNKESKSLEDSIASNIKELFSE